MSKTTANLDRLTDRLTAIERKLDQLIDKVDGCFELSGQALDTLVTMDTEYSEIMHHLTGPEDAILIMTKKPL